MPHLLCDRGKPNRRKPNKKGFTLIEILIVVLVFGVIATLALSTYVKSTGTFDFLSNYKNVLSALRTARVYALTNREAGGTIPDRYGLQINTNGVIVFAETGLESFTYEPQSPDLSPGEYDELVKDFDLAATNYRIEAFNSSDIELAMPLMIFYEIGNGELTIFQDENDTVEKDEHKFIILRVYENGTELERHIMLFQVSGLPEEYDNVGS